MVLVNSKSANWLSALHVVSVSFFICFQSNLNIGSSLMPVVPLFLKLHIALPILASALSLKRTVSDSYRQYALYSFCLSLFKPK